MSRVPYQIVSGSTTTIRLHTLPRAQITSLVQVTTQRVTYMGTSKHRRRHIQTRTLYHATGHGTADKHGLFIWHLRVSYTPSTPIRARVSLRVQSGKWITTRTMTLLLAPPHHSKPAKHTTHH